MKTRTDTEFLRQKETLERELFELVESQLPTVGLQVALQASMTVTMSLMKACHSHYPEARGEIADCFRWMKGIVLDEHARH